jgi:hypothetical protein
MCISESWNSVDPNAHVSFDLPEAVGEPERENTVVNDLWIRRRIADDTRAFSELFVTRLNRIEMAIETL